MLELFRVGLFAGSLVGELSAESGIGILRGLQQNVDCLLLHLHAPVEVDGGADDAEDLGIFAVEHFDILLGFGEVFTAFVEANQGVAKLQASDRVGGERGLLFDGVLADGFE